MQAFAVVETDDVVNDGGPGFGVIGIVALSHPFHFKVQKEAFGNSVDAPMSRNTS
jgi:hypothetical protein